MRKTEITTLNWEQINFNQKTITLWDTKNKEPRVVLLLGKAYNLVSNFPRSSRRLFPGSNIRYFCEKAIREAHIEDFRFHDLRHTAGSYLAQQDTPLLTIGSILGHRSIATTTKYTHLSVDHLKTPLSNLNDMMFPDI
jgi:integrase